jgi:hypothetical protein
MPAFVAGRAMRSVAFFLALLMSAGFSLPAGAGISQFEHIVLLVQENRTPDNLFYALCQTQKCSTHPDSHTYDIQVNDWADKNSANGTVLPQPIALDDLYDLGHHNDDFKAECDLSSKTGGCQMDGAADVGCVPRLLCPPLPQFRYVANINGILDPYLTLATQYGWANHMFQTNEGPSFPAHQFLFGATSAPSKGDDHNGIFVAENLPPHKDSPFVADLNGCIAAPHDKIQLIGPDGVERKSGKIYPCLEHETVADLLDGKNLSWRYFAPGAGSLWMAPNAISHICAASGQQCTGAEWKAHVALAPTDIFGNISVCKLSNVNWVIPSAQQSDHAHSNLGRGPSWVASIINAVGTSPCRNSDGTSYWDSTAIIVVWDDWGGWYDHEPPKILDYPQGGYQYGFRVPLLFVSAYTSKGYINNDRLDFGSIIRFVEHNFNIPMGKLTFADARTTTDLKPFYNLGATPRPFTTIPARRTAKDFINDKSPLEPPDDD